MADRIESDLDIFRIIQDFLSLGKCFFWGVVNILTFHRLKLVFKLAGSGIECFGLITKRKLYILQSRDAAVTKYLVCLRAGQRWFSLVDRHNPDAVTFKGGYVQTKPDLGSIGNGYVCIRALIRGQCIYNRFVSSRLGDLCVECRPAKLVNRLVVVLFGNLATLELLRHLSQFRRATLLYFLLDARWNRINLFDTLTGE